jgi:hypothetical protein
MARVLTVEKAEIAYASARLGWWLRRETADRWSMYIYIGFYLSLLHGRCAERCSVLRSLNSCAQGYRSRILMFFNHRLYSRWAQSLFENAERHYPSPSRSSVSPQVVVYVIVSVCLRLRDVGYFLAGRSHYQAVPHVWNRGHKHVALHDKVKN